MVCIAPSIVSVEAVPPHTIIVRYDTGEGRKIDIASAMRGSFMGALKDESYFGLVRVIDGGSAVGWPEGQDLDPCWIYEEGETLD